eukprot:COSAG01_NODE_43116_length_433_cov_0.769461_1_plen_133_part_10
MLRNPHRSPVAVDLDGSFGDDEDGFRIASSQEDHRKNWTRCRAAMWGLVLGLPGLAPLAWTVTIMRDADSVLLRAGGAKALKLFKALELIVENVPQSVLQTYVGVAYGEFEPSSPTFSYLLPVSVTVSLLGAG